MTFVRITIIIWTMAFVGGLITGNSAFSQEFNTNNISKFAEEVSHRMYKHYKVDDTVNNYVLNKIKYGVSIIGPSETKSDTNTSKFPRKVKTFKQKVVLKNKNKMYWKFQPKHMLVVNPSSINNGLTYSWKDVGHITLKDDHYEVFVGMTYKW